MQGTKHAKEQGTSEIVLHANHFGTEEVICLGLVCPCMHQVPGATIVTPGEDALSE